MADHDEKKLLIKRSETSVEITVGSEADGEESETEEPHTEQTKDMETPETDQSTLFCCLPLTKVQLYWLALLVLVMMILVLFIIVILVGVVASHQHRIGILESEVHALVSSNSELVALVHNNCTKFQARVSPMVDDLSSQFSILFLQTTSLYGVGEEHQQRLDLLTNDTESLKTQLQQANMDIAKLVSQIKSLEEAQNSTADKNGADLANSKTFRFNVKENIQEQSNDNCHELIICVKSHTGHRVCSHAISSKEFYRFQLLFHTSSLDLEYQCIDSPWQQR